MAALGGLALLGGLATALWQKREADLARQVAERRFAQLRQLAGSMVFRYHDQIAQLPGAIATREALLADALRYLDGLLAEGIPDPVLAREVAETYQRIAVLQGEQFSPSLERLADARRNLDQALGPCSRATWPRPMSRPRPCCRAPTCGWRGPRRPAAPAAPPSAARPCKARAAWCNAPWRASPTTRRHSAAWPRWRATSAWPWGARRQSPTRAGLTRRWAICRPPLANSSACARVSRSGAAS